jgi:hypothetical protein
VWRVDLGDRPICTQITASADGRVRNPKNKPSPPRSFEKLTMSAIGFGFRSTRNTPSSL